MVTYDWLLNYFDTSWFQFNFSGYFYLRGSINWNSVYKLANNALIYPDHCYLTTCVEYWLVMLFWTWSFAGLSLLGGEITVMLLSVSHGYFFPLIMEWLMTLFDHWIMDPFLHELYKCYPPTQSWIIFLMFSSDANHLLPFPHVIFKENINHLLLLCQRARVNTLAAWPTSLT